MLGAGTLSSWEAAIVVVKLTVTPLTDCHAMPCHLLKYKKKQKKKLVQTWVDLGGQMCPNPNYWMTGLLPQWQLSLNEIKKKKTTKKTIIREYNPNKRFTEEKINSQQSKILNETRIKSPTRRLNPVVKAQDSAAMTSTLAKYGNGTWDKHRRV